MITHLQAIHASWLVFSASNNKHISLDTLSASFSLQAVQAGQQCHNAGVEPWRACSKTKRKSATRRTSSSSWSRST